MNQKLLEILNSTLSDIGTDPIAELDPNLNLENDLDLDSISKLEFVVKVKNELGVDVQADGIVETLGEVMTALNKKEV